MGIGHLTLVLVTKDVDEAAKEGAEEITEKVYCFLAESYAQATGQDHYDYSAPLQELDQAADQLEEELRVWLTEKLKDFVVTVEVPDADAPGVDTGGAPAAAAAPGATGEEPGQG